MGLPTTVRNLEGLSFVGVVVVARVEEVPEDHSLKPFFGHLKMLFSKFPNKTFVIVLLDIIGLENFPMSFSKS